MRPGRRCRYVARQHRDGHRCSFHDARHLPLRSAGTEREGKAVDLHQPVEMPHAQRPSLRALPDQIQLAITVGIWGPDHFPIRIGIALSAGRDSFRFAFFMVLIEFEVGPRSQRSTYTEAKRLRRRGVRRLRKGFSICRATVWRKSTNSIHRLTSGSLLAPKQQVRFLPGGPSGAGHGAGRIRLRQEGCGRWSRRQAVHCGSPDQ
jgi:hypothetical protein